MTENADLAAGLRAVATRLRSEADIADRPGQMSRLMATAEQIAEAADALEARPPTTPTREAVIDALFYEDHDKHVFKFSDPRLTIEDDEYLSDLPDAVLALLGQHEGDSPSRRSDA
jgi:hypothetical protein